MWGLLTLGLLVGSSCAGVWVLGRGWRRGPSSLGVLAAFTGVLAAPLLVPAERPISRFLMTALALAAGVKLYDVVLDGARGSVLGFLATLPNIFALVRRKADALSLPSRRADLWQLAVLLPALAVGVTAATVVFSAGAWWSTRPFVLEHVAKVLAVYLVVVPLGNAPAAAWRLAGGRGLDFMNHPIAARTPADFWRRYNQPVGQFMWEDISKPLGGLRAPRRGVPAAFAVSGAIHEYLFLVAGTTAPGCQTAFFLIQGLAVAATCRLRPRGRRAVLSVAATLAFTLATSVLFFTSFEGIVPFYAPRAAGALLRPSASSPTAATPTPNIVAEAGSGTSWLVAAIVLKKSPTPPVPVKPLMIAPLRRTFGVTFGREIVK